MSLDAKAIKFFGHVSEFEEGEYQKLEEQFEELEQKLNVLGLSVRIIYEDGEGLITLFVEKSEQVVFSPCVELLEEYKPTVTDLANLSDGMRLLGKDPSEIPAWYLMAEIS